MEINQIFKSHSASSNSFSYVGTLRNARKFEIGQMIFAGLRNGVVRCKIVGVELPPIDNPEYIYKVQIPGEWVRENCPEEIDFYSANEYRIELTCDRLFGSIAEAKESMLKMAARTFESKTEAIERYFKRFE